MFKKTSVLVFTALLIMQTGCTSKKKEDLYKEGEIVTWKYDGSLFINKEVEYDKLLIIKTKVGERRKHIVNTHCPRCERDFYRPQYEHYLGQFPIDYQPKKFPTMTLEEARAIPLKNLHASYPSLEFNLMLNGSWVEATDKGIDGEDVLDDEDQVKVVIDFSNRYGKDNNTRKIFYHDAQDLGLNLESETIEKTMTCYDYKDNHGKRCLGNSTNPKISGFDFSLYQNSSLGIYVQSYENNMYGQMTIRWVMHPKNLSQIQKVDTTIWRLLDAWNVSPVQSH